MGVRARRVRARGASIRTARGLIGSRRAPSGSPRLAAIAGFIQVLGERMAPWRSAVLAAALVVLASNLVVLAVAPGDSAALAARLSSRETSGATPLRRATTTTTTAPTTTTTAPTTTTTTAGATATTVAPTTTTTAPPGGPPAQGPWSLEPYRGVGAWVDVYDWSVEFTNGAPTVSLAQIDEMAQRGVQTLYIQTGHRRSAASIMEHQRLVDLIDRAHGHGMFVVGWYLPMLLDPETDLHRMVDAATRLPLDGFGVDIESTEVGDVVERNRRLLWLSEQLRAAVGPNRALSAITPSAVHLQVVNPAFWPAFPWAELTGTYDVFQPMAYWSVRRPEWRSGERYIAENIDRIRASTGRPDLPVHPVGGIADGVTLEDVGGMVRAATARGAIGLSLYDWRTSNPDQWAVLAPTRR